MDDEVVKEFLIESGELLDQMDADLVELERRPDGAELLDSMFRALHTIKGSCGFLGFGKVEKLSHVAENLLDDMRAGKIKAGPTEFRVLYDVSDALRKALHMIETSGAADGLEVAGLVEQIKAIRGSANDAADEGAPRAEPDKRSLGAILGDEGIPEEAVEAAVEAQKSGDPRRLGEILVESGDAKPAQIKKALQAQAEEGASAQESSIRVDVALLDKLMNLVGELVLARNQIQQFTHRQADQELGRTSQRLNLITTELQEGVMKTRMQPIGCVWNKFPRVVRHLGAICGKKVRVEMEGAETELDKTIIEAIKDPLTHFVRNSVDHGIEMPADRVAAGKPEEGVVSLRAFHEGGQVNMEISDDGTGIDLDKVRRKAVEKGVVSAVEVARMSDAEVANLVFHAGFSTAEKITNLSGRGVGMDVVRTNIERIGGTCDLSTVRGGGTTLKVKIPLTLAIIPALLISTAGGDYALPQISLLELVRLEGEDARAGVETINGCPVYRLRGRLLPLVFLNRELGRAGQGDKSVVNVVVLQAEDRTFGLVVDEVRDTAEIVVKPLGKALKSVQAFAGATILGDGSVALILDVLGLAEKAGVVGQIGEGHRHGADAANGPIGDGATRGARRRMLLFVLGEDRRFGLPLDLVERLEELAPDQLESSCGNPVVQYRDSILPLVYLAEELQVRRREQTEVLRVLVHCDEKGRRVGLVIDEIVDVVDEEFVVQPSQSVSGIEGTAIIQGRVTDLVDVDRVVEDAAGRLFPKPERASA